SFGNNTNNKQVDKHEARLDMLENRVSDTYNLLVDAKEHLLRMDKVLELIKAKNEELEAHSRSNA
ncbi:hypothetical protein NDU88_007527, partial [Pleurodeles waltl]